MLRWGVWSARYPLYTMITALQGRDGAPSLGIKLTHFANCGMAKRSESRALNNIVDGSLDILPYIPE